MLDNWFHFDCFWKLVRKPDISKPLIRGMEWLKWKDQEAIRKRIAGFKGDKSAASATVEHAKSSSGKCFKCKEKMEKGQLRVVYKGSFYDLNYFKELKIYEGGTEEFNGFDQLEEEDKEEIRRMFPESVVADENQKRKPADKEETRGDSEPLPKKLKEGKVIRDALKEQSEMLWNARKAFFDNLRKTEVEELVEANGLEKQKRSLDKALEQLADCAVFGVPNKCSKCKGSLIFSTAQHTYKCSGFVSDYEHCGFTTREPERSSMKIPKLIRKAHTFLDVFLRTKLMNKVYPPTVEIATEGEQVQKPSSLF